MKILITIIIIKLIVITICLIPLIFVVEYDKQSGFKVRFVFFERFFREKKPKKPKKIKKPKRRGELRSPDIPKQPIQNIQNNQTTSTPKTTETPKPTQKPTKPKKTLPDIDFELIKGAVSGFATLLKKLIKKIKISELYINSTVGGADAAKAAINYGLQSAAIYAALAWAREVSSVKVDEINIQPDFLREETDFSISFKARIKLGTIILCGTAFALKMLKIVNNKKGSK